MFGGPALGRGLSLSACYCSTACARACCSDVADVLDNMNVCAVMCINCHTHTHCTNTESLYHFDHLRMCERQLPCMLMLQVLALLLAASLPAMPASGQKLINNFAA